MTPMTPGAVLALPTDVSLGFEKQAKSESCGQTHADQKVGELSLGIFIHTHVYRLQGTNIFHLGKRTKHLKRGYVIILPLFFSFRGFAKETPKSPPAV